MRGFARFACLRVSTNARARLEGGEQGERRRKAESRGSYVFANKRERVHDVVYTGGKKKKILSLVDTARRGLDEGEKVRGKERRAGSEKGRRKQTPATVELRTMKASA